MKKVNGFWTDENNNKWDCDYYTKERAIQLSKTLINCRDCRDCLDCSDCRYCSNCLDCSDCRNCSNCLDCSDCSNCSDCRYCSDCSEQPEHYSTLKIGSRNDITHFYKTESGIMVRCGCFWGTLEAFEFKVKATYPVGHKHNKTYLNEISKVKRLWRVK